MANLDKLVAGAFSHFLKDSTAEDCQQKILGNLSLFDDSDDGWAKYRLLCKMLPGVDISYGPVVEALDKHRPDLLSVIRFTPGGITWLNAQIACCRVKLGLEKANFTRD